MNTEVSYRYVEIPILSSTESETRFGDDETGKANFAEADHNGEEEIRSLSTNVTNSDPLTDEPLDNEFEREDVAPEQAALISDNSKSPSISAEFTPRPAFEYKRFQVEKDIETYDEMAALSDEEVYKLCVKLGLTLERALKYHYLKASELVHNDGLREQLDDFNNFTRLQTGHEKRSLDDGLVKGKLEELWVGNKHIQIDSKSSESGGWYKWVCWKDAAGVIRTKIKSSNVVEYRRMRWPTHRQRLMALSFDGRAAHKPWERERFTNILLGEPTNHDILEKYESVVSEIEVDEYPSATSEVFWGLTTNRIFTLLRVETIKALKLYSQRDYEGFMNMIHKYKGLITKDICNNLNRGPIFSSGMVANALQVLVKAPDEGIPTNKLVYIRDIIYHYLINRNLNPERSTFGKLKWDVDELDVTRNAVLYYIMSCESRDGFFVECQSILPREYGDTEKQRCDSVAAVFSVLYTAFLAAMDVAARENIPYAQSIVSAVGVMAASMGSMVGIPPASESPVILNGLVAKLQKDIVNNNEVTKWEDALRWCLIENFGDMYLSGALTGERVPGMKYRRTQISGLSGAEDNKYDRLMHCRELWGRRFVARTGIYIRSLGERWPCVESIDKH